MGIRYFFLCQQQNMQNRLDNRTTQENSHQHDTINQTKQQYNRLDNYDAIDWNMTQHNKLHGHQNTTIDWTIAKQQDNVIDWEIIQEQNRLHYRTMQQTGQWNSKTDWTTEQQQYTIDLWWCQQPLLMNFSEDHFGHFLLSYFFLVLIQAYVRRHGSPETMERLEEYMLYREKEKTQISN